MLEGYPPHLEPLAPRAFVANASLVSRSAVLCAALWLGVWSAIATEAPTAITRSATIIALIVWYNSVLLSQGRGGFSGFSPPRPPATQARADASILPRPINHLPSGPVLASRRETRSRAGSAPSFFLWRLPRSWPAPFSRWRKWEERWHGAYLAGMQFYLPTSSRIGLTPFSAPDGPHICGRGPGGPFGPLTQSGKSRPPAPPDAQIV